MGKKKRTLEKIQEDDKKKQLAEKDNKEKKATKAKVIKVKCDRCGLTLENPCRNIMTCIHYGMQ